MTEDSALRKIQKEWPGTFYSYGIGFALSIVLTAISFSLVATHLLPPPWLITSIVSLALVQAIIQLRFFLHLGQEPSPFLETLIFYFMVLILLIISLGSLWIMNQLNERVMSEMIMEVPDD